MATSRGELLAASRGDKRVRRLQVLGSRVSVLSSKAVAMEARLVVVGWPRGAQRAAETASTVALVVAAQVAQKVVISATRGAQMRRWTVS